MKKLFQSIKLIILIVLLSLFPSCKNFMSGGDILNKLEEIKDYQNADYVSVVIVADMDYIKDIQPSNGSYSKEYKVTDVVKLSVTEKKEYVFLYWSIEPSESVEYLNKGKEKDKEIEIKILNDEAVITIKPVCAKRPEVTITPDYRSEGVAKNTSITVNFSKEMELTQDDISQIKIESAGIDYSEYYERGLLSDDKKMVTITARRDNLIPYFGGVKEVKVTVPESFGYKVGTTEDSYDVLFSGDQELYFRINNQTIERIKVTGKENYSKGKLSQEGNNTLNYDDSITFTFIPTDDYFINGWFVQDPSGTEISKSCIEQIISEDKQKITVYFRALPTGTEEIFVIPDVIEKDKLIVNFVAEHAKITPAASEQLILFQGDSFTVDCVEEKTYYFQGWKVCDKNGNEIADAAKYVKFKDSSLQTTTVTVLKAGKEIYFTPKLIKRPTVTLTPENTKEGVAKNSSITLTFSETMNITEEDIAKIRIENGGIDYKEYFSNGEIIEEGKQITFVAKRNNLIPYFSDVKEIEVTIPQAFSYNAGTEEKPINVPFYEDQKFSYRINNNTSNRITVTGKPSYTKGELVQDGLGVLNFDESVTFYFNPNKEYVMNTEAGSKGWIVEDEKHNQISTACVTQEISADKKQIKLTFKEPCGAEEIFVSPDVIEKPKFIVNFSTDHAMLIPSDQKIYYKDDVFTIDCREESDYYFLGWRVYEGNGKSNREITDYSQLIEIDNKFTQNTTVTVLKEGVEITLKPELAIRPKVVSATPMYDSAGVFKDRRISVMFDHKLDPECIYFDKDDVPTGYTELRIGNTATGKIYAYFNPADPSEIVYKAFKITKLNDTDFNLLDKYGEPTFDSGNTGVLKLGPKSTAVTPPGSTDILVTVNKDLGYKVTRSDGKEVIIPLSGEYKWAYYTNQESDANPPQFVDNSVKVYLLDKNKTELTLSNLDNSITNRLLDKTEGLSLAELPTYNAKGSALWLKAQISDAGSGPESITVNIYRDTSDTFKSIYSIGAGIKADKAVYTKKLNLSVQQQNGTVYTRKTDGTADENGCYINLVDELNSDQCLKEEGVYYIELVAQDKNGITKSYSDNEGNRIVYYFAWDVDVPEQLNVTEKRTSATSTSLEWNIPNTIDFQKITVEGKKVQETNVDGTKTSKNESLDLIEYKISDYKTNNHSFGDKVSNAINGLTELCQYEYVIKAYDWAGNYSEVKVKDDTSPAKPELLNYQRKEKEKSEISFKKSSDVEYSKTVVKRYAVDDTEFETCLEIKETTTPESFLAFTNGLENKTNYVYRISHFDYSGNESEPLIFKNEKKPTFKFTESVKKDSVSFYDNEFEYLDGKVRIFFDDETILEGFHASIDYKRTYNDIAPQPRNIKKDIILDDVFFDKNKKKYVDIPLYRNGHQYTFAVKVIDYDGIESDPVEIKTNTYIIEDIAQTESKTAEEIGQFVLFGRQETYSGMSDVLTKETNFRTYGNDEVSFNQLLDDLATDICNDEDSTTKDAIIAAQQNKANGTGTTEKETILKNFEEQVERINASKATHGNITEYFKNYIKHPGSFTNKRTNGSNETITLKPYQIGKYETVERFEYQVEYDYKHSYDVNYTNSSSVYPWGYSLYFAIQCCNKMSLLYGFEPCYTLYRDSNCSEIVLVYEWVYEWKYDNSDNAKKTNNYANWDNNLICDFSKNGFRLPSDLEWECAARNGKQTGYDATYDKLTWFLPFSTTAYNKESYDNKAYRAGVNTNDNNNTDNPERKPLSYRGSENIITPNYLGLWQMCGNAMEWVWDVTEDNTNYGHRSYETPYGLKSTNLNFNTDKDYISGPFANDVKNACRGGSWWDSWWEVFITSMENDGGDKYESKRTDENKWHGYRIARTIDPVADNSETR